MSELEGDQQVNGHIADLRGRWAGRHRGTPPTLCGQPRAASGSCRRVSTFLAASAAIATPRWPIAHARPLLVASAILIPAALTLRAQRTHESAGGE